MSIKIGTVASFFIISIIIGCNLLPTTVVVQAAEPVIPSIIELPKFDKIEKMSVDEINVEVDLSTLEVSVNGTTDAKVNVKTVGEPTPIVKWKTKLVEKEVNNGYPYVKNISKVSTCETPISPINLKDGEQQSDYLETDDKNIFYHQKYKGSKVQIKFSKYAY